MRNFYKLIIFITLFGLIINCANRHKTINGHWHCVTEFSNFKTLDIDDSATTTDKYEIFDARRKVLPRKNSVTGKSILPFEYERWTENFQLNGDTLIVTYNEFSHKYLKSNIENCALADRYNNSQINISLQEYSPAEDYDQLRYCANLLIGKTIKEGFNKIEPNTDTIFVQAMSVFISKKDIPNYIYREEAASAPNEPFEIVIHADRAINEAEIKRVLENVSITIPTYRAVNNS